ncbi:MAG: creatininase family protein [Gemmatimonadales bacterium]|nr:creatininase family protein [Gemmatimonadales bacterium]
MRKIMISVLQLSLLSTTHLWAQGLPPKWEELTAADFVQALEASEGTCALPLGVIEKHGPSGPIGTDLINIRYITTLAAAEEYTVMFPEYFVGQIHEAIHQPGTIVYSPRLQLDMLQETVSEMARNGCRKVILVNGHGGNNNLVQYFVQTQLASPRDYMVYAIMGGLEADLPEAARPSGPGVDGHAGEGEISNMMASRPDLAHPERAATESGANQARLNLPQGVYTAIWWYASFPNHYGGNAAGATAARGEAATKAMARRLAEDIRAIKQDEVGPRLQREFFDRMVRLNTPSEQD